MTPLPSDPDRTPPAGVPTVAHDADGSRPRALGPVIRLSVELRIAGMVATLWWVGLVHAVLWSHWAGSPWRNLADLPWVGLVVPQLLALGLVLRHVLRELPAARWPRRRRHPRRRDPRPWLVLGLPALLVAPVLWLRDRRAREHPPSPAEVEAAFERLLARPIGAPTIRRPDRSRCASAPGRRSPTSSMPWSSAPTRAGPATW